MLKHIKGALKRLIGGPVVRVGVGVIIRRADDNRILMGKRKGAHGAGTWSFPGGHLEFGEEIDSCAKREVWEETGLIIGDTFPITYTEDYFDGEKHYITIFVGAWALPLPFWRPGDDGNYTPSLREPAKCEEWRWVEDTELPQPVFLPVKNMALFDHIDNTMRLSASIREKWETLPFPYTNS